MEYTHTQDHILLNRWQLSRDAEAFRALADRYASLVYAAAHRVLRNPADAEDVAQECFMTLARTRKPPQRNLGAWLHTVTVNRAKDHIRSASRRRNREAALAASQPTSAVTPMDDTLVHVDEAIAALDDDLRQVIVAHFLEAKSQGEIAEITGVSRQTVNARVKRGIEAIRENLGKKGITTSVTGLTAALGAQMTEAAPAALVATLGKVALSGGAAGMGAGLIASLGGAKVIGTGAAFLTLLFSLFAISFNRPTDVAETPSNATDPIAPRVKEVESSDLDSTTALPDDMPQDRSPVTALADHHSLAGTIVDVDGSTVQRKVSISATVFPEKEDGSGLDTSGGGAGYGLDSEDGTFAFTGPMNVVGQGYITARDSAKHYVSEQVPFDTRDAIAGNIVLQLRPGGVIAGTLRDKHGKTLRDLNISISDRGQSFSAALDDNGNFRREGIPPGVYTLTARVQEETLHNGGDWIERIPVNMEVVVPDFGAVIDDVDLRCDCEQTQIAGRLVDESGKALVDAQMRLGSNLPQSDAAVRVVNMVRQTDASGRFSFEIFGPGTFEISGAVAGYEIPKTLARAGASDLVIAAQNAAPHSLKVKLLDPTGAPVTQPITYSKEMRTGSSIKGTAGENVQPVEGRFAVKFEAGVSTGVLRIAIKGLGSAEYSLGPEDLGGPEVTMRLRPNPPVSGRVVDSQGVPVPGARIQTGLYSWTDNDSPPRALTNGEGRFELEDMEPWQDAIHVVPANRPYLKVAIERKPNWTIRLPQGGRIEGVATAGDAPLVNVRIALQSGKMGEFECINRETRTDAGGHYLFEGLAPGPYRLAAEDPPAKGARYTLSGAKPRTLFTSVPGEAGELRVKVSAGTTTQCDFSNQPIPTNATLSGTVYEAGQPISAGVNVSYNDGTRNPLHSYGQSQGIDGYRIEDLIDGEVEIRVKRDDRTKKFTHQLHPGDNQLDVRIAKGGAMLVCSLSPSLATTTISLDLLVTTMEGDEEVTQANLPVVEGTVHLRDLPEGHALVKLSSFNSKTGQMLHLEQSAPLRADSETTLHFETVDAGLDIQLAGPHNPERTFITLVPGVVDVAPLDTNTTFGVYIEYIKSLGRVSYLEWARLELPLRNLEPGTYTLIGFTMRTAESVESRPADAFPDDLGAVSTVVVDDGFLTEATVGVIATTTVPLEDGLITEATLTFPEG